MSIHFEQPPPENFTGPYYAKALAWEQALKLRADANLRLGSVECTTTLCQLVYQNQAMGPRRDASGRESLRINFKRQ